MDHTTVPAPDAERADGAAALRFIADAVAAGNPEPIGIYFRTETNGGTYGGPSFMIRTADNDAIVLSAWAEQFGLPAVTAEHEPYLDSTGRCWRSYSTKGAWRGWTVDVWAAIDSCRVCGAPVPEGHSDFHCSTACASGQAVKV